MSNKRSRYTIHNPTNNQTSFTNKVFRVIELKLSMDFQTIPTNYLVLSFWCYLMAGVFEHEPFAIPIKSQNSTVLGQRGPVSSKKSHIIGYCHKCDMMVHMAKQLWLMAIAAFLGTWKNKPRMPNFCWNYVVFPQTKSF